MAENKENIKIILGKITEAIEPVIEEILNLDADKKYKDIIDYQNLVGGKRLRPVLAILSCLALGGKIKDVLYPAAGLEILHNYTLIVDDIIDKGALRRGKPTVWKKFGKSIAQCVAIDYSAAVFQAANRSKAPEKISEIFAKTEKTIAEGEILDILFEQKGREKEQYINKNRYKDVDINDYFEMISKKTAVLFGASCETGGVCANANQKQIIALKDYGFNLGLVFQIGDDILDILGDENKFGKKIGKDIEERKGGNIVIYFASQEFSQKEKKEFWQILRKDKISKKDINKATRLIKNTKAKEKAISYGEKFMNKAKENLKLLPQNKYNLLLKEIADSLIKREK